MYSTAFLVKMKLSFGFGLGVILLAGAGVASYVTISQLTEASHVENRTQDRLLLLERANTGIKAAEASLRQYLLSGNALDLQKIGQARTAMDEAIGRMRSAGSLPEQLVLDQLMAERWTLAAQSITARQSVGQQGAVDIINSDLSPGSVPIAGWKRRATGKTWLGKARKPQPRTARRGPSDSSLPVACCFCS